MAEPLSAEALASLRERHWAAYDAGQLACGGDAERWPCDSALLLAEVTRLRALLADLVTPVEAFYWAMHGSRLLAPDLDATLRTALAATRAAVGLPESP